MKRYSMLFSLLSCFILVFSQSKFGKISNEELKMQTYEEDTTATALVLQKVGNIKFVINNQGAFQYEYTEEKRIKILKPEGLSSADQEIDYFVSSRDSKEEITNLSGTTYNLENGKVSKTKLTKKNIFDEDADGKWHRKKFTMPAAKVGSVIEYKYTVLSDFVYDLKDFYFQESLPVKEVFLSVVIPEYFNYHMSTRGYASLGSSRKELSNEVYRVSLDGGSKANQSGSITCSATQYNFDSSNVPSAKDESFIWSLNDFISKVSFELRSTNFPGSLVKTYSTTWEKIDKELMDHSSFGKNLNRDSWFKNEIEKGDRTIEKATEILCYIKNKIQWNKENRLLASKLKKSLDEGVGSSSDMNFLLLNALSAGGFNAYPVVLSTRSNGYIPITHPSISALNYVIAAVEIDGKKYYTDASSKFSSWNLLPEKCMVNQARILYNGIGEWVDLSTLSSGTVLKYTQMRFEDNKSIVVAKETRNGNSALDARTIYSNYTDQDKFIQNIEENNSSVVSDFFLEGYEDNNKPLITSLTETKDVDFGDYIYLSPPLVKLYKENPFKSETRMFPINFDYLLNHIQVIEIDLPEGYEVVEIPKNEQVVFDNNLLSYQYTIIHRENKITLNVRYRLNTLLILPTEYAYIKDFFAKIINKSNEQIVLKKQSL